VGISQRIFVLIIMIWIVFPVLLTVINCTIQIIRLRKMLNALSGDLVGEIHKKNNDLVSETQKKNNLLAALSAVVITFLVLGGMTSASNPSENPWTWLSLFYATRLTESIALILVYIFFEKFTWNSCSPDPTTQATPGNSSN